MAEVAVAVTIIASLGLAARAYASETEKLSVFVFRSSPALTVKYRKSLGKTLCVPDATPTGVVRLLETKLTANDPVSYFVDYDFTAFVFVLKTVRDGKEVVIGNSASAGRVVAVPGNGLVYFDHYVGNNRQPNRYYIENGRLVSTMDSLLYAGYDMPAINDPRDVFSEKSLTSVKKQIPAGSGVTILEADPVSAKTMDQWYRVSNDQGVSGWALVHLKGR